MTISEALISLNSYPIPQDTIDKICIDRGLVGSDTYSSTVSTSQSYILATADVYFWLHGAPSLTEQEVGVNQAIAIKQNFLSIANRIYGEYDDPKYVAGKTYGLIGESFNG